MCAALFHFALNILPQAGARVSFHHVVAWNIADDAVDAAIARNGRFDVCDQVNQFLGGVRMEFAALPVFVQLGIGKQLIRVDFYFVGTEIIPQFGEVCAVTLRSCAQQIRHPMQDDLESSGAQQGCGFACAFHIMSAFVDLQNMVVKTLRAHLHFGHAEVTQPAQFIWINFIGAGLDHQPHVAMRCGFVDGL